MLQPAQLRLAGLFAAITVCFVLYSLIQERLMTLPFGEDGERFNHSLFVILVNRIVTMAVAAATLALTEHSLKPAAPAMLFSVPSITNVLASAAQYEALKYVSFPLQALAKCAKTVPVMLWGLCLGGNRYSRHDYLCSAAVTVGCAIFVLTGDVAAPSISGVGSHAFTGGSWALAGSVMLLAFLLLDGLASTSQDRLFSSYSMHSCNQLLWVTTWSAGVSFGMLSAAGQLGPAVAFVVRNPTCLWLMLCLSALSTAAQLFIFYTIQQYGALKFALVMTVRQFLSIVLSCLVFAHHLTIPQWAGTALVIGALVHRTHRKPLGKKRETPSAKEAAASAAQSGQELFNLGRRIEGQPGGEGGGEEAPLISVIQTNQKPLTAMRLGKRQGPSPAAAAAVPAQSPQQAQAPPPPPGGRPNGADMLIIDAAKLEPLAPAGGLGPEAAASFEGGDLEGGTGAERPSGPGSASKPARRHKLAVAAGIPPSAQEPGPASHLGPGQADGG